MAQEYTNQLKMATPLCHAVKHWPCIIIFSTLDKDHLESDLVHFQVLKEEKQQHDIPQRALASEMPLLCSSPWQVIIPMEKRSPRTTHMTLVGRPFKQQYVRLCGKNIIE